MQGPLVGEKKSTLAITEEYATADPIYITKTQVQCPVVAFICSAPLTFHDRHYPKLTLTIALSEVMAIVDGEVCLFYSYLMCLLVIDS